MRTQNAGNQAISINTERDLVALAVALGAAEIPALSKSEAALVKGATSPPTSLVNRVRAEIAAGKDPLGVAFSKIRSPADRRPLGATYTPKPIVSEMVRWARQYSDAARVVDPGVGSGRFLRAAGAKFPEAQLVGVEIDPLAALLARATLAVAGFADRSSVLLQDYRELRLPPIQGRTLFIGNPPYVRHHEIEPRWKRWLTSAAGLHRLTASQLAGLHVHFYLATVGHATEGDFGVFITSSEWLDVNYGKLVRELFLGPLGGMSLVMVDPTANPFPDAATTAVIATFESGLTPTHVQVRRAETADNVKPVGEGQPVRRERLMIESRWSHILRAPRKVPEGYIELGELCRVHRGAVTGSNRIWIAEMHDRELPESVLYPSVTKAKELLSAGAILNDLDQLKHVIDIPADLDELSAEDKRSVQRFMKWAKAEGASDSYVASHRSAWWAVGLRTPPPILSTYMARRPPAFVRNRAGAHYINIAHGIYPRERMTQRALDRLRSYLSAAAENATGRIYAGGLQKFEPREVERIPVPNIDVLEGCAT